MQSHTRTADQLIYPYVANLVSRRERENVFGKRVENSEKQANDNVMKSRPRRGEQRRKAQLKDTTDRQSETIPQPNHIVTVITGWHKKLCR